MTKAAALILKGFQKCSCTYPKGIFKKWSYFFFQNIGLTFKKREFLKSARPLLMVRLMSGFTFRKGADKCQKCHVDGWYVSAVPCSSVLSLSEVLIRNSQ